MSRTALIALAAAAALAGGAASAQSPQASALTPAQAKGKALFDGTCVYCHGPNGHATGLIRRRLGDKDALITERTNLTAPYIHIAVRRGINSMPWYRRAELSDADLAAITEYLTRLNPSGGSAQR
jgi:mono/diheme cytochrome c family protein